MIGRPDSDMRQQLLRSSTARTLAITEQPRMRVRASRLGLHHDPIPTPHTEEST